MNEKFWETIYREQIGRMIGICYRYVANRQVAEDLAHDAFISAIKNSGSFKGKGKFEAWLRRIVVNVALQYLRDQKKKKYLDDWMLNNSAEMETPNDNTSGNIATQADFSKEELMYAVNSLPEHHRLVFNLYVIDKFTHDQIGTELGISPGTSKSHLARARKKLREILYQKATEKLRNEDRKRALLLLIIPFKLRFIDRIYKRNFSDFTIEPLTSLTSHSIRFSQAPAPVVKSLILTPKILISVGIPVIISATLLLSLFDFIPGLNIRHEENQIATKNEIINNIENVTGTNESTALDVNSTEPNNKSESEKFSKNSDPKTATISPDSIIIYENQKNTNDMKKLNQLGALLIATSSVAFDSSAELLYANINDSGEINEYVAFVESKGQKNNSDTTVKEVVAPNYDIISEFGDYRENWALVQKGKLKGFIDTSGKEVVEVKYNEIFRFNDYRDGWAMVKSGRYSGFIDTTGREVVELKYNEISEFGDYQDTWALVEMNKMLGFIDTSGVEVIEPNYDIISEFNDYKNNWALVRKGKLYGFIDNTGREIVELKYNEVSRFGNYKDHWALVQKGKLYGFIDELGNEVVETKYSQISDFGGYQKHWALVEQDNLRGFIDTTGNEVVDLKYNMISYYGDYQKNWALVTKDKLKGFIDRNGNEVVETKYDDISRFGDYRKGWALVEIGKLKGFIDSTGKEVVEVKYEEVREYGSNHKDWLYVKKDGMWGAIDVSGKEVVTPKSSDMKGVN